MSYMSWEDLERTYTEMYNMIETNDEGEITMRTVVEHIKGVEAGSGNNVWVNDDRTPKCRFWYFISGQ